MSLKQNMSDCFQVVQVMLPSLSVWHWDLIIQTSFQYSDRELINQIAANLYLQYFIGLLGFQEEAPFDASTLVLFRKRISAEMLMEANEYLLDHKDDDKDASAPLSGEKTVTMILQKKIQIKELCLLMQPARLQTSVIRRTARF